MKNTILRNAFIFLFLVFITSSCATVQIVGNSISSVGNINILDDNCNVVKTYKNVNITNEMFKSFGLNFYDVENKCYTIISESTKYNIEYTVTMDYTSSASGINYYNLPKDDLISYRKTLLNIMYENTAHLKKLNKNSEEYNNLKLSINTLNKSITNIDKILFEVYGIQLM